MDEETRSRLDAMFDQRTEKQRLTKEQQEKDRERRDQNASRIQKAFDSVLEPVILEMIAYLAGKDIEASLEPDDAPLSKRFKVNLWGSYIRFLGRDEDASIDLFPSVRGSALFIDSPSVKVEDFTQEWLRNEVLAFLEKVLKEERL